MAACPNCKKDSSLSTNNPYRPFCCERCKMVDLGQWFTEENVISEPVPELLDNPELAEELKNLH